MTDRGRYAIPALVAMVAAAMAVPSTLPLTSLGTASHDPIDSHLFLWGFWWTNQAMAGLQHPYWTDLLLYPTGTSLVFFSYPLPYALASLPIQALLPGITGPVVAFNVVAIASFALSALAAYALSVRLTANRLCGVIAGLIFACMPYRLMNVARLHVLSTEFLAALVLAWIYFTDAPSRARALVLAATLAATFYTSPEYALYGVGFIAIWLAFHWRRWREFSTRPFASSLALAAIAAIVVTGPLVVAEARAIAGGDVVPARALDEAALWSPALVSFITPSRQHPVYGSLFAFAGEYEDANIRGMRSETTVGLTAGLLALVGVLRARRDASLFWGVAAAVFLILTLGPYLRVTGTIATEIPLPYLALYHLLPPLRVARDPTRMLPMAMLMLSVLAAFGCRAVLGRMRTDRAAAVATAVCLLVLFESLTRWPAKTRATDLIPEAYAHLAGGATGSAVIDLTGDHQAMLAQTLHGLPITGGRYANPRSASAVKMLYVETDLRDPTPLIAMTPERRARALAADREMLQRLGIRYIVAPSDAGWVRAFAVELGARAIEDGRLTVYEWTGAPTGAQSPQ